MASNSIVAYPDWEKVAEEALRAAKRAKILPEDSHGRPISEAEAWLRMQRGRELGLQPLEALHNLYVINNRVALQGSVMLSLVQRSKLGHVQVQADDKQATVKVFLWEVSKTEPIGEVTFTMKEAKQAGLTDKWAWQKYPRDMLTWRAVARACRIYFAALFGGPVYVPEELSEMNGEGAMDEDAPISHSQVEEARERMQEAGLTGEDLAQWCREHGIDKRRNIPRRLWPELLDWIDSHTRHEGPKRFIPKDPNEVQPSLEEVTISEVELDEG